MDGKDRKQTREELLQDWQGMEKLVELGLTKRIGISNCDLEMIKYLVKNSSIKPFAIQVEGHPYFPQHELLDYCLESNIQFIAYSPLGSSTMIKSILNDPIIVEIANRLQTDCASLVLAWGIQRGTTVIPKSTNPIRMKENLKCTTLKLSLDDMELINKLGTMRKGKRRFCNPDADELSELQVFTD